MRTFAIIIGLAVILVFVVYHAMKLHSLDKEKEENLEEDVEDLKSSIDSEMEDLEKRIDEFEV